MKILNPHNNTLNIVVFSMTLALSSGAVLAEDPYASLDSYRDGPSSQPEYNSYMEDDTRRYEGWDQNQDRRMDENEWIDPYPGDRGEYNSWDRIEDNYHDNE